MDNLSNSRARKGHVPNCLLKLSSVGARLILSRKDLNIESIAKFRSLRIALSAACGQFHL